MKKGMATFELFLYIFLFFFAAIFLGVALFMFNQITDVLSIDVDVGQVNLREITNSTLGKMNTAFINMVDTMGILLLFGMILLMLFNAYFIGSQYPRIFIVLDIFILIFAFITAIYLSQIYEIYINSTPYFEFYITDMPLTSKFILKLPWITSTVGVLIMILSYSGIRKDDKGDVNVLGY